MTELVVGSDRASRTASAVRSIVDVRTDDPEDRYVAGSVLATDPATAAGPLTIGACGSTPPGRHRCWSRFDGVSTVTWPSACAA